eukprot:2173108-Prymnesium_polylepis.1
MPCGVRRRRASPRTSATACAISTHAVSSAGAPPPQSPAPVGGPRPARRRVAQSAPAPRTTPPAREWVARRTSDPRVRRMRLYRRSDIIGSPAEALGPPPHGVSNECTYTPHEPKRVTTRRVVNLIRRAERCERMRRSCRKVHVFFRRRVGYTSLAYRLYEPCVLGVPGALCTTQAPPIAASPLCVHCDFSIGEHDQHRTPMHIHTTHPPHSTQAGALTLPGVLGPDA